MGHLVKAKALDGRDVEFVVEDKGLFSHENFPDKLPSDWPPSYVTMFVIDGKRTFSETPAADSNGSDRQRLETDFAALRSWGIDTETVLTADDDIDIVVDADTYVR